MSVIISSTLTDLLKKFLISALDNVDYDEIYDLVDKIYSHVKKDADEHLREETNPITFNKKESDYKGAAKIYLLASKVLFGGSQLIKNNEISGTLKYASMSWQTLAEETLYDGVLFYSNKAYEYAKHGKYEKSTEWKNKGNALEYQIKSGFFNKIGKEITIKSESLYDDVLHELEKGKRINSTSHKFIKSEAQDIVQEPHIDPAKITIKNDSTLSKTNYGYNWSVYLDADDDVMQQIDYVTYTLHPTFPEPVQTIYDPRNGFKLEATSRWEFQIKVDIHLKEGETISMYYWLHLGDNWYDSSFFMPDTFTAG